MSDETPPTEGKPGRITLDAPTYARIESAAYWEGARDVSEFVERVMRRYIAQREEERGSVYPPPEWAKRGRPRGGKT